METKFKQRGDILQGRFEKADSFLKELKELCGKHNIDIGADSIKRCFFLSDTESHVRIGDFRSIQDLDFEPSDDDLVPDFLNVTPSEASINVNSLLSAFREERINVDCFVSPWYTAEQVHENLSSGMAQMIENRQSERREAQKTRENVPPIFGDW